MTSWTDPKTFTGSTALTAAELNTYVRDNTKFLYEQKTNVVLMLPSNLTRSSGSWGTITGLTFPVVSGLDYNILVQFWASGDDTGGGFAFGWDHPGGNGLGFWTYSGESSSTSQDHERITAVDTGSGVATVDSADVRYFHRGQLVYNCTSSGTYSMRWKRNTAGTATLYAGSCIIINSI